MPKGTRKGDHPEKVAVRFNKGKMMCKAKRLEWVAAVPNGVYVNAKSAFVTLKVGFGRSGWWWSGETLDKYATDLSTSQEAAKQAAQAWFDNLWASEIEDN